MDAVNFGKSVLTGKVGTELKLRNVAELSEAGSAVPDIMAVAVQTAVRARPSLQRRAFNIS